MQIVLFSILIIAFLVRVYHLNFNTPFLDEAQYIMVGKQILGGDIEGGFGASSWVGGFPFVYPLITAVFYSLGGLLASRGFVVVLGVICVYLMYYFTRQLSFFPDRKRDTIAGLIAASFMAVTTVAVTTSRLAIYDGLAFTLFFTGVVTFHKAIYSGEKKWYLWSALIFFLSFISKYIVLIYFPLFVLVPLLLAWKLKQKGSIKGIIKYFYAPFLLLTGGYIGLNFSNLTEFFVNQGVIAKATETEVAKLYLEYTGFSYILFLIGAIVLRKQQFLVILLLAFSLLPLVIHALTGNVSSVMQHTFLAIIFLLPVVGAMFAAIIQKRKKIGLLLTGVALVTQIFITLPQVQSAESFWPNLTESAKVLKETMKPSDRILAEAGDSMYLELKDIIPQDQLDGPFVFSYGDKEGQAAYIDAIANKYFTYVQLEGTFFSEEDIRAITLAMEGKYEKIYDDGTITVFKAINE